MSEKITADNLDEVVKKNAAIRAETENLVLQIKTKCNKLSVQSTALLAIQMLRENGLIMMPVDNPYFGGAIYVKDGKKIPFINTAQPRANQYFTAWHEIYHLIFDKISFDHVINVDAYMEERKAENFASQMLLGNLLPYYLELPKEMEFISKVCCCMDVFQAPYKAIMISLYETAVQSSNEILKSNIKANFDNSLKNISILFEKNGLDSNLVLPSNVINLGMIEMKVREAICEEDEIKYHRDNLRSLEKIKEEIYKISNKKSIHL
ncbi:hypothetical protein KQI85_03085 [Falcatimonas sp. MSJ-15]|uniref:ImmA/IrrE family metallo-endopeptidase n=1 Tax=Falcatimonas sp. MSJ-15 TaxID=2841515 RepID=UPI001C0F6C12|nr:hypothetical protein [Falcatimonas sp. MSJ-15]MBU5469358.1 hypothetical protein [Falcatimonas sp. MSJ-15]